MKSTVCIALVWLLLAFTMCLGTVALQMGQDTTPAAEGSLGRHLLLEGVPNFGEVTPMLYRGGQPTHQVFERLAQMGINIVVETGRSTRNAKPIKQLGMRYVFLPWYCPFPKDEVFARFLRLIRENPDKRIFVHCRLGSDRTGMMIAAYRMGAQGWTAEQAMKEMHSFGYGGMHHLMCPGAGGIREELSATFKEKPGISGTPLRCISKPAGVHSIKSGYMS